MNKSREGKEKDSQLRKVGYGQPSGLVTVGGGRGTWDSLEDSTTP